MTVYEKLAEARIRFQNAGIKKSGLNKGVGQGLKYFELSDILPECNKICQELKAVCVVSFFETMATLDFIDAEKPGDKITFASPMSKATLKGCHEVQNLGAVQTYIKRYLYQNAFEIAEADMLDSTMNPNPGKQQQQKPTWSQAQLNELGGMLATTYPDGKPVFNDKDKAAFNKMYQAGSSFELAKKQASDIIANRMKTAEQATPATLPNEDEIPF
jgi:hypothetical protein